MADIRLIIAFFSLIMMLGGCAPPAEYVGVWKGERVVSHGPENDIALATTLGRVELELKQNGRFVLTEAGIPSEGEFSVEDQTVHLRVDTLIDRPAAPKDRREIILVGNQKDGLEFPASPALNLLGVRLKKQK